MKRYFSRFIVAFFAFVIGISLAGFFFRKNLLTEIPKVKKSNEQSSDKIPRNQKQSQEIAFTKTPTDKTPENQAQSQEITFAKISAGSAVNTITKERISFMDFRSSDGINIQVNHFYVSDSYEKELVRFENKLKKAKKVLEITPILDEQKNQIGKRALFNENGQVKILKLFKVDEKEYFSKFEFYETVAPNLKYALAFENRKR